MQQEESNIRLRLNGWKQKGKLYEFHEDWSLTLIFSEQERFLLLMTYFREEIFIIPSIILTEVEEFGIKG
jgi:hypothetical protein